MNFKIIMITIGIITFAANITLTYYLLRILKRVEKRREMPMRRTITFQMPKSKASSSSTTQYLNSDDTTQYLGIDK